MEAHRKHEVGSSLLWGCWRVQGDPAARARTSSSKHSRDTTGSECVPEAGRPHCASVEASFTVSSGHCCRGSRDLGVGPSGNEECKEPVQRKGTRPGLWLWRSRVLRNRTWFCEVRLTQ